MSCIARAEGKPAIVPPFHAPNKQELRERLLKAGLPESGMENITLGRNGKLLPRPVTVGWIYWGKTCHITRNKIHSYPGGGNPQMQTWLEFKTLTEIGATEIVREHFNTRNIKREDADTLANRLASGIVEQAGLPSPMFTDLKHRLAMAGIGLEITTTGLQCRFAPPNDPALDLAVPISHPWFKDQQIQRIGIWEEIPEYAAMVEANARLLRMINIQAPELLNRSAVEQLKLRVEKYFEAVLSMGLTKGFISPFHDGLRKNTFTESLWHQLLSNIRVCFTGRTVASPSNDLRIDQVGLAEDIVWPLFGPMVTRELKNEDEVNNRTRRATEILDRMMAKSWIIIHRAPTVTPTSFLAFHPMRIPDRVVRLHPMACGLLNVDFDGDQVAVSLPITEKGQCEVGKLLSVAGHLRRDRNLIDALLPPHESLWGLAELSRTPEGMKEILRILGCEIPAPDGFITRNSLAGVVHEMLECEGIEATLEKLERLVRQRFQSAGESGASISPFTGQRLRKLPIPVSDDPAVWETYMEQRAEAIASDRDFSNPDLGPQLLAVMCGARGTMAYLSMLTGPRGVVSGVLQQAMMVRHGFREGLTPEEMFVCACGARMRLSQIYFETVCSDKNCPLSFSPDGFNFLARALRAKYPGAVFALAATREEIDPLSDMESRLFVGIDGLSSPL
jgi:hypothetical protein